MRDVVVAGVGMTKFGKFLDRGFKSLVAEAVDEALADAGAAAGEVGVVYYGNTGAGSLQGQEATRGQHAVYGGALAGAAVINVENGCASGSTAVNQGWLAVASGQVDVAIAIGAEKLNHPDKSRAQALMTSGIDQDRLEEIRADLGPAGIGSILMDVYARYATWYMDRTGATREDFAQVTVKNHAHGAANPKAHYGKQMTIDEVLAARIISGPLTLPMCAPMTDGAAAAVITTPEVAARWGCEPVRLLASVVQGGRPDAYGEMVPTAAQRAYEIAGLGPDDVDVVELHDAASPAELIVMEELGLCGPGEAPKLLRAGETQLGGKLPINPSGGLGSKGHPVGATGVAQIVELADQLRSRCGQRQVDGARVALAENVGGYIGPDAAVATITVLGAA